MKHLFFSLASFLLLCLSTGSFAQSKTLPYTADFSSNFKIGNPAYSTKLLEIWKDWDDNQLSRHDYFSDTMVALMPDGSVTKGKTAIMEMITKYRASMTKSVSTVHAWVPLHSNDKNDDLVCIWGTEVDTMSDGKTDTKEIHEVWWFNKDGKAVMVRQWLSKFGN